MPISSSEIQSWITLQSLPLTLSHWIQSHFPDQLAQPSNFLLQDNQINNLKGLTFQSRSFSTGGVWGNGENFIPHSAIMHIPSRSFYFPYIFQYWASSTKDSDFISQALDQYPNERRKEGRKIERREKYGQYSETQRAVFLIFMKMYKFNYYLSR